MVYDRAACAVPADDERTRRAGLFVTTGAPCARLDAPPGVEQSADDGTIARLQENATKGDSKRPPAVRVTEAAPLVTGKL